MQTKKNIPYYLALSVILFSIEFLIAVFAPHSSWIRGYGGDILIIPLIYCLVRIFVSVLPRLMPFLMCCIGFAFEIAQYFQLADKLGLEKDSVMRIIIGTNFSWWDNLCYIIGMICIYIFIFLRKNKHIPVKS